MSFSNQRAYVGLSAKATPARSNSSGTLTIGEDLATVQLTDVDTGFSFEALLVGSATLSVVADDCDVTGTTAWTAGTAQVETATAAGTISGSGNASVVVTASGMTGSPKTISVAVTNGDTAATWAGKVRTALAADSAVSALFTVGGSTTAISLTRKATTSYSISGSTVSVYPANDATLNISLDNGTCTGITTAGTSANTTAGVATAGVYKPDADGLDFEGNTLVAIASGKVAGVLIRNDSTSASNATISTASTMTSKPLKIGGYLLDVSENADQSIETYSIATSSGSALIGFTSFGATA